MAKIETYSCDQCHRQKQAANHWYKAYRVSQDGNPVRALLIAEWGAPLRTGLPRLPEMQGVRTLFNLEAEAHLCGQACVTEYLSKNLF